MNLQGHMEETGPGGIGTMINNAHFSMRISKFAWRMISQGLAWLVSKSSCFVEFVSGIRV